MTTNTTNAPEASENSGWIKEQLQYYRPHVSGVPIQLFVVGSIGIIGALIASIFSDSGIFQHLLLSWLSAVAGLLLIGIGFIAFILLQYLFNSGWATVIKRQAEHYLAAMPWLFALMVPLLLVLPQIFHWTHAHDSITVGKSAWLNQPFFILRWALIAAAWIGLARKIRNDSFANDHDQKPSTELRSIAAPGLILMALSLTVFSFDWIMSLDHHWYSTIFAVYCFSQGFVTACAILTMAALITKQRQLKKLIAESHFHNLTKLCFAFSVFWAYIAFSQGFLIWYANIPEETAWYIHRSAHGFNKLGTLSVIGLFGAPFLMLLSVHGKQSKVFVIISCLAIFLGHFTGMIWLVLPAVTKNPKPLPRIWIDLSCWITVISVALVPIKASLDAQSWVPWNDARLKEVLSDIEHENHNNSLAKIGDSDATHNH